MSVFLGALARSLTSQQAANTDLAGAVNAFALEHKINGPAVARLVTGDNQDLNWTVSLECQYEKSNHVPFLLGSTLLHIAQGLPLNDQVSCRLSSACSDADQSLENSYSECVKSTDALGYCQANCSARLACSSVGLPSLPSGIKLAKAKLPEKMRVTNPSHSCSRPDVTTSFTEIPRYQELHADFQFYAQHASAAYCNGERKEGEPINCGGICPLIEANNATALTSFTGGRSDTTGYVAVDHKRREVVLAVRGSWSLKNWLTDLKVSWENCDLTPGCKLHTGFYQAWEDIASRTNETLSEVLKKNPGYRIIATGHSLGGAVATVAAAYLRRDGMAVDAFTFGAPRVGNVDFANFVMSQPGSIHRVTHGGDPVPRLPPLAWGYAHTSPEYWIAHAGMTENNPTAGDLVVCQGIANPACNVGTYGLELPAHFHYFAEIDECRPMLPLRKTKRDDAFKLDERVAALIEQDRQIAAKLGAFRKAHASVFDGL
ncbi:hypothetical protein HIM_05186 [Hirsutella minnesotensis 3608]|uniref:Fungal lipase-type domain-containing protein n=1 Tax=Hirsutella minnesotensis 3608 TaxID=1043627 RepID=A0A0F7ZPH1_9HYPO|nr:hypothetical protein HIM_05186 [Hirsutella minnesotensis 3608]